MSITASMVKELRERTGVGMMECKKALVSTGGDMNAAIELLRTSGQAKADKKSGRVAADGLVSIANAAGQAVIIEINSETDFVAKDENFAGFTAAVAQLALESGAEDVTALLATALPDGRSVEQARTELVAKVGENITVRRLERVSSDGPIGHYIHGGARIGALLAMRGGDDELARDVAMHVAATSPACIDASGVPAETLEQERRIFSEQAEASGKPPEIIEKMVQGRLAKFLKEITLLGQPFVKDPDVTIAKLLTNAGAEALQMVRFEVGEGIEKKEENFAKEVMDQINSSK